MPWRVRRLTGPGAQLGAGLRVKIVGVGEVGDGDVMRARREGGSGVVAYGGKAG